MNLMILFEVIILSTIEANPLMNLFRPMINIADVGKYNGPRDSVIRDYLPEHTETRRPPCGPNSMPGDNCEHVTICKPLPKFDSNIGEETLHDKPEKNCIPYNSVLRGRYNKKYYLNEITTSSTSSSSSSTSTFPPYLSGTAGTAGTVDNDNVECENVASCKVHSW